MDNVMTVNTIELSVPDSQDLRDEIAGLADAFIERKSLLPPVAPAVLSGLAADFLGENGLDEGLRAFAMVCLGNALWRPAVSSVPFERRILVLPECLRNSRTCRASRDALGILCEGCAGCSISEILSSAESLGYSTIVAEGTTAARRLIEEGGADALIGVGCMESLSKINDLVYKYSVPGIGVPLLKGGCEDTLVDTDWLGRELRAQSSEEIINFRALRERAKSLFTAEKTGRLMGACRNHTDEIAREYLLLDGKRIRPALVLLAYDAFARERDEHARDMLALSIECFHKASLIHDDIEDNDDTRYGVTTLHCRYGVPLAINAGDFLIGEGYRLIAASGIGSGALARCLSIASQGHVDLTVGQGEELYASFSNELLRTDEVITHFKNKTAAAFRIALQLGAAAAGAGEQTLGSLAMLSDAFGIAFQIRDDLEDCRGEGGDILSRKNSIILSIAFESLDAKERELFIAALNAKDKDRLFAYINACGAIERAAGILRENLALVYDMLERISNAGVKLTMCQIISGLFGEYI